MSLKHDPPQVKTFSEAFSSGSLFLSNNLCLAGLGSLLLIPGCYLINTCPPHTHTETLTSQCIPQANNTYISIILCQTYTHTHTHTHTHTLKLAPLSVFHKLIILIYWLFFARHWSGLILTTKLWVMYIALLSLSMHLTWLGWSVSSLQSNS